MKKAILALLGLLFTGQTFAQEVGKKHHYTLIGDWDFDGAAASTTAIHSADAITDSATFTLDAQPDTPRPLTVTVVDGDGSIVGGCTYTVVGTLADGTAITATTALTGGSGTKTLSATYNWATVTSASVSACTGEGGGDTVALGTTTTIPAVYFLPYGTKKLNSQNTHFRNYNDWLLAGPTKEASTSSDTASATLNTAAGSTTSFSKVSVGDLLLFNLGGEMYERAITTKSSDDAITVDEAILVGDSDENGEPYRYRKLYYGPDTDDAAIPVGDFTSGTFVFIVTQMGNNLTTLVQCRNLGGGNDWITVDSTAFTAAGTRVVAVDFRLAAYDQCRAGLQWATSDADGDAGAEAEIISIQFVGVGRAGE